MAMNKTDLVEKFNALVAEHGKQWVVIADAMNRAGIQTLKGQQWTQISARQFYLRNCDAGSQGPLKSLPAIPHDLPEWLDAESWEDLKTMLEWWRTRMEEPARAPGPRPMFKGERRNTGVHVNAEILRRAMEKAKREKAVTGGSMSLLVEWLLWRYIGEPQDVLEPLPEREASSDN